MKSEPGVKYPRAHGSVARIRRRFANGESYGSAVQSKISTKKRAHKKRPGRPPGMSAEISVQAHSAGISFPFPGNHTSHECQDEFH